MKSLAVQRDPPALDASGKNDEALALWKQILVMAEATHDQQTARTARPRIDRASSHPLRP